MTHKDFGLYIHIPFCPYVCPYCDFVKSAYYEAEFRLKYRDNLIAHLKYWLQYFTSIGQTTFSSVNFGGGTPSIYSHELEPVMTLLTPYLTKDTEVSLEANPEHLDKERLSSWLSLGINRLSIGIQSFQNEGLAILGRRHTAKTTTAAISLAREYFTNLNLDLIYAWPKQTVELWQADLQKALSLDPSHLSLYNLSYEKNTPLGRAMHRGRLASLEEATQEAFYKIAQEALANVGFDHEEVSNWSKPGFSCRHNWLYWTDKPYIGVGAGASGYLPDTKIGWRYSYSTNIGLFTKEELLAHKSPQEQTLLQGDQRSKKEWLLEVLLAGLRTKRGIDYAYIEAKTDLVFKPTTKIKAAIAAGKLQLRDTRLFLTAEEWFRENYWILAIEQSFV